MASGNYGIGDNASLDDEKGQGYLMGPKYIKEEDILYWFNDGELQEA